MSQTATGRETLSLFLQHKQDLVVSIEYQRQAGREGRWLTRSCSSKDHVTLGSSGRGPTAGTAATQPGGRLQRPPGVEGERSGRMMGRPTHWDWRCLSISSDVVYPLGSTNNIFCDVPDTGRHNCSRRHGSSHCCLPSSSRLLWNHDFRLCFVVLIWCQCRLMPSSDICCGSDNVNHVIRR